MSKDLIQKAAKMVINGATIMSEPCPYCKGVRIIKDGNALCINCGKEPDQKQINQETNQRREKSTGVLNTLERKLEKLSKQLEKEDKPTKQQELIKSIDGSISNYSKIKGKITKVFIFTLNLKNKIWLIRKTLHFLHPVLDY